jgi:hypothetical protein
MKIWKFPIELKHGTQEIRGPAPLTIRHFGIQDTRLTVWAEVNPVSAETKKWIRVVGTGSDIPKGWEYRGTVQDGCMVWHLYEDTIPF